MHGHGHDHWRTSSYSGQNGECVALNGTLDAVRDTKNGEALHLSRPAVSALVTAVSRWCLAWRAGWGENGRGPGAR